MTDTKHEQNPTLDPTAEDTKFQTGKVLTVNISHFVNDSFGAFLSPLLPRIIENLSLSLTQAGLLTSIYSLPSILNPLIGDFADRNKRNKYLLAFAPALLATSMSLIGVPQQFIWLCMLAVIGGFATATYHAVAPPMVARASGDRVGRGMSFQMAAGEMGRMLGPIIAVWAVSQFTLQGIWRMMFFGWAASILLALRLRDIDFVHEKRNSLTSAKSELIRFFIPIAFYFLFVKFINVCISTFMPTYLTTEGVSLTNAGIFYAILQAAGVIGALFFGSISDKLDHQKLLIFLVILTAIIMVGFLFNTNPAFRIPLMILLGFFGISKTPILMAMVQSHFPNNRALANGIYMAINFAISPIQNLGVGALGDHFGLHTTYYIATAISLLAIPAIFAMPKLKTQNSHS
jgi:FSR family fosmidomycin resistance protein-like MFS transporter